MAGSTKGDLAGGEALPRSYGAHFAVRAGELVPGSTAWRFGDCRIDRVMPPTGDSSHAGVEAGRHHVLLDVLT